MPDSKRYIHFQTFFNLLLWLPFFYQIQQSIGLAEKDIFNIQTFYYLAFFIIEIPTGHLSDRYGHHIALRLGAVCLVIANILPLLSDSFAAHLALFIFIALARGLVSGSANAWLYEKLLMDNQLENYKKIEGDARSRGLYFKVIAWPLSGLLMHYYQLAPYGLTAIAAIIATYHAFKLSEVPIKVSAKLPLRKLFDSRLVSLILLGSASFVMIRVCQVNLFQPLLIANGVDARWFGFVMALMTLAEASSAKWAYKLAYAGENLVQIGTLLIATAFLFLGKVSTIPMLLLLLFFSSCAGLIFPIGRKLINDNIKDSGSRALCISVESLANRLLSSLAVFLLGPFFAAKQYSQSLEAVAIIAAIVSIICFLTYKRSAIH